MVVRHWMTTQLVTVHKEASVQDALSLMKEASVRHLPVVEDNDRLVGWVTDADLRGVLIAAMLEELAVADVMVREPYLATPETSLEDAAALILNKRIGGLPVVEDDRLVGVITVVDILRAFIGLMGLLVQSCRIDVRINDQHNSLEEVTRLIRRQGGEIISVCHLPQRLVDEVVYTFRLQKCDLEPIVQQLRQNDIEVVTVEGGS